MLEQTLPVVEAEGAVVPDEAIRKQTLGVTELWERVA